jgi:hypothetical protein
MEPSKRRQREVVKKLARKGLNATAAENTLDVITGTLKIFRR